jgi:hypothetical protein
MFPSGHEAPPGAPGLGRALKIRSMVTVAGEQLPFVWPMRNFIHHNPLHGLEHLPFEEAVARAAELFHAQGYLRRTDYQDLLRQGEIDPDIIAELIRDFLDSRSAGRSVPDADTREPGEAPLDLAGVLLALMTRMDQPSVGNASPSTDAILAQLRRLAESS